MRVSELLVAYLEFAREYYVKDGPPFLKPEVEAGAISPAFLRRVLDEYGSESVRAAFLLRGEQPDYWLEYLLRSFKGQFYRSRYPRASVV